MQPLLLLPTALLALGPALAGEPASPQRTLLGRIRATFAAADLDDDGKLSAKELARAGITEARRRSHDANRDGLWCHDEFLMSYRELLKESGRKSDPALEKEAARIQALRKAKEQRGKKRGKRVKKDPQPLPEAKLPLRYRRLLQRVDAAERAGKIKKAEAERQRREIRARAARAMKRGMRRVE